MKEAYIKGYMIPNEYKWAYDWFGYDSTCPKDIQAAIETLDQDEDLYVYVGSPGGSVVCGQEIFTMLKKCNATAFIESEACSAASVAIMGAKKVVMSPVGLIMIHNSSAWAGSGDKNDMQKIVGMLSETDKAIASAYADKTGMSEEDLLKLMNDETWLTAKRAVELGFADEIMSGSEKLDLVAAFEQLPVTEEMIAKARAEKEKLELESVKQEVLSDLYLYGI